jgi:RNA polymerase sigma factor (sigma-70 family)
MSKDHHDPDMRFVHECLSGSEGAWNEFYVRFVRLVRTVVRRQPAIAPEDSEDVTQTVFVALVKGLKDYDGSFPLARFVGMVAQRVCIQEYRRLSASKRSGDHERIDENDQEMRNGNPMIASPATQEHALAREELVSILKMALAKIGSGCKKLLELRYMEELPYKDIAEIMGMKENTATVQTRRCLEGLSVEYSRLARKGAVK